MFRRSYGPEIEAASGIEERTGYEGGEPLRLGHPLPDPVGGHAGALAALRGLRERAERGLAGWYDISQLETYVAISGEDYLLEEARCRAWATGRVGGQSRASSPAREGTNGSPSADEYPGNAQLRARGFFLDVPLGGGRSAPMPGSPLGSLADPAGASPNFGDHTQALLDEIAQL